jgi:DNA primase catalytic core
MSDFDQAKEQVNIADYIGRYVSLEEVSEQRSVASCPFHEEDEPSFNVYSDSQKFHCFGCDEQGDVFDFALKFFDLNDMVEALGKVCDDCNLSMPKTGLPKKEQSMTLGKARDMVTTKMTDILLNNKHALEYLASRDITEADVSKYRIGLSDGKLYAYFKKIFKKEDDADYQLLVDIGVAKMDTNGKVSNYIREGTLTFPVTSKGEVSHWILRSVGGSSKHYQLYKKSRGDALFINQDALKNDACYIGEGPIDVITADKYGYKAVGIGGTPTNEQVKLLQGLCSISSVFPEDISKQKTFFIALDRDENNAGQKRAQWLATELCQYHTVFVCHLPKDHDLDSFLRSGGDLNEIDKVQVSRTASRISEKDNKYYYQTNSEETKVVSNFIIRLDYEHEDPNGFKSYIVTIIAEGAEFGPYAIDSRNWKTESQFREWLGRCGGQFNFSGGIREMDECRMYWFQRYQPKSIKMVDGYGNLWDDYWVFDNGIIRNGEVISSDTKGVTWLEHLRYGVSTITSNNTKQVRIPEQKNIYSTDRLIELFHDFYEDKLIWLAFGYATATFCFRTLANRLGFFPILFLHGPKQSGKTTLAELISQLCGGGLVPTPSQNSSSKGIYRTVSQNRSMSIVLNEFQGLSRESLIVAFYDLDPYVIAAKSTDGRTISYDINSSCILTSINCPRRDDLLSRLITVDFHSVMKDQQKLHAFTQFYHDGMQMGGNIGFLKALSAENGFQERTWNTIQKLQKDITKNVQGVDSRQVMNLCVVLGSFLSAYHSLNMRSKFEELGIMTPKESNVRDIFYELASTTNTLMDEQHTMRYFFELVESLVMTRELTDLCEISEMDDELVMYLPATHGKVLEKDKRTGANRLDGFAKGYFARQLKTDLDLGSPKPSRFNGENRRWYRIPLDNIKNVYGVEFGENNYE